MQQIDQAISLTDLTTMSERMYGGLVKGVIDIKRDVLVLDAEMHADLEQFLLQNGSSQNDLWGINLYPHRYNSEEFVEFDSMINLRPSQKNLSRGVEDAAIRQRIIELIAQKVVK